MFPIKGLPTASITTLYQLPFAKLNIFLQLGCINLANTDKNIYLCICIRDNPNRG